MNILFEECKEALGDDCYILDEKAEEKAEEIFYRFPISEYGTVIWEEMKHVMDYSNSEELLNSSHFLTDIHYIIADTMDVPIFRSSLHSILRNFDDVSALSVKVFIFNEKQILVPMFPYEKIRLGIL